MVVVGTNWKNQHGWIWESWDGRACHACLFISFLFFFCMHPLLIFLKTSFFSSLTIVSLLLFFHFSAWLCFCHSSPCCLFSLPHCLQSRQRNLQLSTPSIYHPSLVISLWIYPNHRSHRNSPWPFDNADEHERALIPSHLPSPFPVPLIQAFPFISGCLLAGCCLLVAAACKRAIVRSWSFVLHGVFITGGEFSQCPSPSVSGTLLHFSTEQKPHPPLFFIQLYPHHIFSLPFSTFLQVLLCFSPIIIALWKAAALFH